MPSWKETELTYPPSYITFLSILNRKIPPTKERRKRECDEEAGIIFIRGQEEEAYKLLISPVLARVLSKLVFFNDNLPAPLADVSPKFNAQSIPEISINSYLQRLTKYTPCSPESFLVAIIFIDRIITTRNLLITSFNVHRFLITSILIAAKILDDSNVYNNKYYAHVGGVPLKELNELECTFLSLISFDLNISPELFQRYRNSIELAVLTIKHDREISHQNSILPNVETLDTTNSPSSRSIYKSPSSSPLMSRSNDAKENAKKVAKKIRRSHSFNNVDSNNGNNISEPKIFNKWRKKRSISFNVSIQS